MKPIEKDKELEQLLKQQALQPGDNPWFTSRVLNKLPSRASHRRSWMPALLLLLAIVVCVICWLGLIRHQDFTVITVRDLLTFVMMVAASLVVLWHSIMTLIKAADA